MDTPKTISAPVRFEYRLTRPDGGCLAEGDDDMHLTMSSDDLSTDAAARAVAEVLIRAARELIRVCRAEEWQEDQA